MVGHPKKIESPLITINHCINHAAANFQTTKKKHDFGAGWWLSPTPLKNDGVRQLGWLFNSQHMESHKSHVPNHQPVSYSHIINHYQPSLTMINHYWPSLTILNIWKVIKNLPNHHDFGVSNLVKLGGALGTGASTGTAASATAATVPTWRSSFRGTMRAPPVVEANWRTGQSQFYRKPWENHRKTIGTWRFILW